MPLSAPVPRAPLHRRQIELQGFQREDGLFDIEAWLTDTKSYAMENRDRGSIAPGEPLHGMGLRLTVDETLLIVNCEAATDFSPYSICPRAAPNFGRLAGLRIGKGFTQAVKERVGGVEGCTHLRELLGQMATVAFQTVAALRMRRERESGEAKQAAASRLLGTCLAYAPDSPVTRARFPEPA
ncbi:DUF2889 domain-containing protein [Roseomonas sp. BN140053]|uniref:DUF2889 domain-containing protein n=1 Tax=Roseomonas sp. BN140053 TaxID=3391898 RepID=UPI0039EA5B32